MCAFLYALAATSSCFRLIGVIQVWTQTADLIAELIDCAKLTENAKLMDFDGVSASSTTSAQGQNLAARQQFIIAKRNPFSRDGSDTGISLDRSI